MLGLELQLSAVVMASHVALIFAALVLFDVLVKALHTFDARVTLSQSQSTKWAMLAMITAFMMERLYYVCAWLLKPMGQDLWALHPAPEVLSALLAITFFVLAVMIGRSTRTAFCARQTIALASAGLAMVWVIAAALVW